MAASRGRFAAASPDIPAARETFCDAARLRAPQPASSQGGDWHDVTGHHRYYGSSAVNGGERIAEDRRGPRPRFVNLCGF